MAAGARLERGRIVPRENLHFTLAFLGRQPRSRIDDVVETLRRHCAETAPPSFDVERYRETGSVGMLVFSRDDGAASNWRSACSATCSAAQSATRGCRMSRSCASASARGYGRRCRNWSRS